jgi:hypothetical protein
MRSSSARFPSKRVSSVSPLVGLLTALFHGCTRIGASSFKAVGACCVHLLGVIPDTLSTYLQPHCWFLLYRAILLVQQASCTDGSGMSLQRPLANGNLPVSSAGVIYRCSRIQ